MFSNKFRIYISCSHTLWQITFTFKTCHFNWARQYFHFISCVPAANKIGYLATTLDRILTLINVSHSICVDPWLLRDFPTFGFNKLQHCFNSNIHTLIHEEYVLVCTAIPTEKSRQENYFRLINLDIFCGIWSHPNEKCIIE